MRKLATFSWAAALGCALVLGSAVPAFATEVKDANELQAALTTLPKDENITLTADITLTDGQYAALLNAPNGMVIDGAGHTLTGLNNEGTDAVAGKIDGNAFNIVDAQADVTVKNITLKSMGRHALNITGGGNVTLDNVTLDHTSALTGAPLVIGNGSQVTVDSALNVKIGGRSWYGINVDVKKDQKTQASLTFGENAKVAFSDTASTGAAVIQVDSDGKLLADAAKVAEIVKGADKAGLTVNEDGKVVVTPAPEPEPVTSVTMFRLYNKWTGEHFYTSNKNEHDVLVTVGWTDEGTGWTAPVESKTPVYRLYNPYAEGGDHHYTKSTEERDALVKLGWKYEGIGWYSDDAEGEPLYRQYNPYATSGTHNYTVSKKENDDLVKLGWKEEGVAWYGVKTDQQVEAEK